MKRILYSCLLLVSLFLSNNTAKAQAFNFSITPQILCFSNAPNSNTAMAAVTATQGTASSYSWNIQSPNCGAATFTVGAGTSGTAISVSYPCCGVYTVTCLAFNNFGPVGGAVAIEATVVCPTGATVVPSVPNNPSPGNPSALCIGYTATLTASGANTYTWSYQSPPNSGPITTVPNVTALSANPLTNTSYTVVGITATGCTVSTTSSVGVQSATMSAFPLSQTICPGTQVCFTTTANGINTPSVLPGTTITGFQWTAPPPGAPITAGPNKCVAGVFGTYTSVVTHTGVAGTCTLSGTTQVFTISTIPVTITPVSPSVCPGQSINLTANSQQTASPSYTWTSPTSIGRIYNATVTVPTTYTVDVTYFGCTGSQTVLVGMRQLTINLSSSSPSTCPGRSLTLTASNFVNTTYTFSGYPTGGQPTITPLPKPTNNTAVHSPIGAHLPIIYCVNGFSAGCTGTTCITVDILTINPTLTASSPSICPGRNFTLSTTGGAGTTYTYTTPSSIIVTGATRTLVQNTGPGTSIYSVDVDSAGCLGNSVISIDELILATTLTTRSSSVCLNTAYSFTASGGAGTNYTFTAPPTSTPPALSVSGNVASHTAITLPHTYTVEADSAGCRGTAMLTISELTLTPLFTSSSASICSANQFTLSSSGGAGTTYTFIAPYPVPPSTVHVIPNNPTSNSVEHTPPNSVIFPLKYALLVDSAGCKSDSTFLTIGLLGLSQNLTLTASSPSVCPGTQFTLNASGGGASTTYSFFAPPTNTMLPNLTVNSAADIFNPLNSTYTVSSDSSGCVGSKTLVVHQLDLNNVSLIPTPSVICAGRPTTITATGAGAGTTYTFAAISPTAIPIVTGTVNWQQYNPTVMTVYSVYADSAGCKIPFLNLPTTTVNLNPPLSLTTTATSSSICAGLSSSLSVAGGSASSTYTYSWFASTNSTVPIPPGGTVSAIVVNPTTTTIYTVSAIDPDGCVGESIISVGIDPFATLPILTSVTDPTICLNLTTTLSATPPATLNTLGGNSTIGYTWTPGTSFTPSPVSSSVIVSPTVTTLYTVTASNPYGCVGTNTVLVYLASYPTTTIQPTASSVCVGFTSTLTAFGAFSYTWSGTTFSNSIAQQSVSVGPGTYTVIGSNGGGCIKTATVTIQLARNLTITATASSPTTCIANNSPKFSKPVDLKASGAATYAWFPYNPNNMTFPIGPLTTVRPHASTCYTVIGSTAICAGQTVICVSVNQQFSMSVIPPLPAMCLGDSLKLSIVNIHTLAAGPASAFTYSWTEAANAPPISIRNNLASSAIVFPQNTTTYSVEVFDSRACASLPRLVTVTVLPKPLTAIAIPTINSVATNTVCFVGQSPGATDVTINLIGNNVNTNLQFGVVPTYTWISPYSPKHISILTPENNNAVTVNAPIRELNGSAISVYTLISGYNGVQGCKRMDTVSIRVVDCRPVLDVKFTTTEDNDTICARNCITFTSLTDTMAGGPQTYTWSFRGGSPATSTLRIPTVCYNLPGKYNVILSVSNPYPTLNANGGSGSSNTRGVIDYIKVVDIPNVTIVAPGQLRNDTTVRFGQSVNLNGSGALSYNWFPNYNITSLADPKVTVRPFKTTQYILTGYNSRRCASSDTINVIIIEDCGEMYVPNAFTPNNDEVNDVLYVRGICLQSLTFMVFNRWGEKVFETADQSVGWNGMYKGEELNTGVFVYRLEGKTYDGKSFSSKGNVTLIR